MTLQNAAIEPEIIACIEFLNSAGANIHYAANKVISIHPVESFSEGHIDCPTDRIVALTLIVASILAKKSLCLRNAPISNMKSELSFLQTFKYFSLDYRGESLFVTASKDFKKHEKIEIVADSYPAISSDSLPLLTVLSLFYFKNVITKDLLYQERFDYLKQLVKFGVSIRKEAQGICASYNHKPTDNSQDDMEISDIRGGMASYLFLLANGLEINIRGLACLDRGYEESTITRIKKMFLESS